VVQLPVVATCTQRRCREPCAALVLPTAACALSTLHSSSASFANMPHLHVYSAHLHRGSFWTRPQTAATNYSVSSLRGNVCNNSSDL
jgi:hypothetical protein